MSVVMTAAAGIPVDVLVAAAVVVVMVLVGGAQMVMIQMHNKISL